ncbi:MAG: 1-deoxy-D-xylulose-5-phosphate reductoisomerase [Magnetovibrio sp.]|nr:1-deoxy-D-xylulose-5-phosphate reductoisomerase [Magnetovibrio sp.]
MENTLPKTISILGSTGSIGCNTVDLINHAPKKFKVQALSANNNVDLLAKQARQLNARLAVIANPNLYNDLKNALAGTNTVVAAGPRGLIEAAALPSERIIAAIVGAAGLAPTLESVRRGATIGLANKECLVSAGALFTEEVEKYGATLLPVDSEHSAIFQVFDFKQEKKVEKIILTASGGPFLNFTKKQMSLATSTEAVAHPNWKMGAKISIDSATMMNKGLELIEAYHLFPVEEPQIEILIHPQSVIHSMVEYIDGSVLAQLGTPDMRTPIAYAISWPERMETPSQRLSLAEIGTLTFETPDIDKFPSLLLAREALIAGGSAPTILNAANEIAVHKFLTGEINFLDIAENVDKALQNLTITNINSLDDVISADTEAREFASSIL